MASDGEPEDITSFRPGDTVISIRKRIQNERKQQLELLAAARRRPTPASAQKLTAQTAYADGFGARSASDLASASGRNADHNVALSHDADLCRHDTGRSKPKVERFHRNMIRKEVWRRKFDYLFKQMQEEEEDVNARGRPSVADGETGSGTESQGGEGTAVDENPTGGGISDVTDRTGGSRAGSLRLSHDASALSLASAKGLPWLQAPSDSSSSAATAVDEELVMLAPPKLPQAGWRLTPTIPKSSRPSRPSTGMPKSKPSTASKVPGLQSTGSLKGRPLEKPGVTTVAGLLQSSASLPTLQRSQDLLGLRSDYYEGDDTFMHEDILYASNPSLFPLRKGHNKQFPLTSLAEPPLGLQ